MMEWKRDKKERHVRGSEKKLPQGVRIAMERVLCEKRVCEHEARVACVLSFTWWEAHSQRPCRQGRRMAAICQPAC